VRSFDHLGRNSNEVLNSKEKPLFAQERFSLKFEQLEDEVSELQKMIMQGKSSPSVPFGTFTLESEEEEKYASHHSTADYGRKSEDLEDEPLDTGDDEHPDHNIPQKILTHEPVRKTKKSDKALEMKNQAVQKKMKN